MAVGTWLRPVSAILVGILVAFSTVALVQRVGHFAFPPPRDLDSSDAQAIAAALDHLPFGALLFVVVAWTLGSLIGAAVASWMARTPSPWPWPGLAVGAAVLGATGLTLHALPHPLWMTIAGLALPLPAAWLGSKLR